MRILKSRLALMMQFSLVAASFLLMPSPGYAATNNAEERRDARDTKQTTRQDSREAKQDCRAADQKNNANCRQEHRDSKQDGRKAARDIKY